jgi:hypothetical protein
VTVVYTKPLIKLIDVSFANRTSSVLAFYHFFVLLVGNINSLLLPLIAPNFAPILFGFSVLKVALVYALFARVRVSFLSAGRITIKSIAFLFPFASAATKNHTIVHSEPLGIVTVTPSKISIGPAVTAFFPVVKVYDAVT